MRPAHIELHVEELVLHGFALSNRYRIGEAVERELARLLVEQGMPSALAQKSEGKRIDGGAFNVAPGAGAEAIGAQVAQAIFGGFDR